MDPNGTSVGWRNFMGAAVTRKCRFPTAVGARIIHAVDTSVVVALTLTSKMIGATGVMAVAPLPFRVRVMPPGAARSV